MSEKAAVTPEEARAFADAWRRRDAARRARCEERRRLALARARKAAALVKKKYHLERVILFGSAARGNFWEQSDIDLAIAGLEDKSAYLALFGDVWEAVRPFKVDVVLWEDAGEKLRARILAEGVEL